MIFDGRRGPFSESKSIKIRFRIEFSKQLHLTAVFSGSRRPSSFPRAPKSRQDPPRTPNMAATWGQLGALKGFQELQNIVKILSNSKPVAEERPEPLRAHFGVDFGRLLGVF